MENTSKGLPLKRTIAALIDITFAAILSLFIFFLFIHPIIEKTTDLVKLQEEYISKGEEYNVMVWNELISDYEENKDASKEQIAAFNNDPIVKELSIKITNIQNSEIIISFSISLASIYILMPLISRHGCTFGKKALGLNVISRKDEELKKSQVLLRESSFIIIEIIGGIISYGIIPFVSLALIIFSKKKISLHDYLSKTDVIFVPHQKIEVNKDEDDEYYDKIALEESRDLRLGGKKHDK